MNIKKLYFKHEKLSLFLITIFLFVIIYFPINHISSFREATQLGTSLDDIIPFMPASIFIYNLAYVIWFVPFFFVKEIKLLRKLTLAYISTLAISSIIFLIMPVKMIRPELLFDDFTSRLTRLFYSLDKPYNLFPSLHVAFSSLVTFFSAKYMKEQLVLVGTIALLIIISSLTIKQHYVADVFAGFILAGIIYKVIFKNETSI